ncbi:hypothetical protein [Streptomyces sp. NPDC002644]
MGLLLYYPNVNPPTEIVHQALLYWDGLASVVPRDPRVYGAVVGRELRQLEDRGLYEPLAFADTTLDMLPRPTQPDDAPPGADTSALLAQELLRMADRPTRPRPEQFDAVIYTSKLCYWLEDLLLRLGLARRGRMPAMESLLVPQEVQTLIIGVLARELADNPEISLFPYTDSRDAFRDSLRPTSHRTSLAWEAELGRLLPVPAPGTPTSDVLAFRERHDDERRRLMRALHRLLGELRQDYDHPADVFAQVRAELSRAVADYEGACRGSRVAWVQRSVTVSVAVGAAAAGALLVPDLGWLLGTVGGYALNVATREIRPLVRARDEHQFSYLHQVRGELT